MLIVLKKDVTEEQIAAIKLRLAEMGLSYDRSADRETDMIEVRDFSDSDNLEESLRGMEGVEKLVPFESDLSGRDGVSRRGFLDYCLATAAALGVTAVVAPIVGFLIPPEQKLEQSREKMAAKVSDFEEVDWKLISFGSEHVVLIHAADGNYYALGATCTHSDVCIVRWDDSRQQLVCPCHNGMYDVWGNVVSGPPPRPLQAFAVRVLDDKIFVGKMV